jgi:phage terminase large subunit
MAIVIKPQDWAQGLYKPSRYKILYGGRGGGKSYEVADYLIVRAHTEKTIILCAREFQNSIKDSVHALIASRIEALGLADWFEIQEKAIYSKVTGTAFIFKGIRHNIQSIKSMFGVGVCWVEEAQTISRESWEVLKPTIREKGSEIICTLNPLKETDPIYNDFIENESNDAWVKKVNWSDNRHFPDVLEEERKRAQRVNPDTYAHIWEGELLKHTDAQVLKDKWTIDDFTPAPDWNGPYFGADWGFSKDPTTLVKAWIYNRILYIEAEAYGVGVEITETPQLFDSIEGSRSHVIRADSARPETISFMRRQGFNVVAAKKGAGSVEEGVAHLRSFDQIVINPRCRYTQEEARLYSYKVDRLSGDILPVLADAHNHIMDALRYALEPVMKPTKLIMEWA